MVCLNQAPWPMRVRFPLGNQVHWSDEPPHELGTVRIVKPTVSENGSTIVIPGSSMIVCHAEQSISPTAQFTAEADDARRRVAEVTRQVTTIVEHLGILGELAGITARPSLTPQHLAGSSRFRANHALVRQASARTPSPSKPESSASLSGGSSFWSTERWGFRTSCHVRF